MDINNIYSIMHKLEKTSAKTGKEQILKEHKGDKHFREALIFLLNPYIVTGLSTKKINKKVKPPKGEDGHGQAVDNFEQLIDFLKKNNSGRDSDIHIIQRYIKSLETEELQTFVRKYVTKDLKLGISEKTVNKVYGKNTIPSFSVMLAESYEKKESKVNGEFYATLKLDGNRCVAIKENDVVKFFSRKGQPIVGMVELEEQFKNLADGIAYDGELLLINKNNLPSDELFRATQKVVRKDGEKKDLEFHIFDIIVAEDFKAGKSKTTYKQRRAVLDLITPDIHKNPNIKVLPVLYKGTDKAMIPVLMKWVEESGNEGIMINTADGLYESKRTSSLLKVKTMKTADLLVMSVEKAIDGQFEGLLSRVNVEYKGNLVGVGSGFTLEQRKEFIENPDLITGKIIEVQFFEESKDEKTGQPSLRFPVFKGIREDKGVEDINYGE